MVIKQLKNDIPKLVWRFKQIKWLWQLGTKIFWYLVPTRLENIPLYLMVI